MGKLVYCRMLEDEDDWWDKLWDDMWDRQVNGWAEIGQTLIEFWADLLAETETEPSLSIRKSWAAKPAAEWVEFRRSLSPALLAISHV